MFTGCPTLISLLVISTLSLSQAADKTTTPGSPSPTPECASNCMSIKITEAASWFGVGDVKTYCKHPEFLEAYNSCLTDHCPEDHMAAAKEAGLKACAGVINSPGGNSPHADPRNSTAHPPISGPAGAPENSTLPGAHGINPGNSTNTPTSSNGTGLNGALTTANSLGNSAANATNRFTGAVGSAAANASSQAGAASAISSPSAVVLTLFSSCLLSLVI